MAETRSAAPASRLHVFTAASLVDIDTESAVVELGLAALLDGRGCPDDLAQLPCLQQVRSGEAGLVRRGAAQLVFDRSTSELRCRLTFELRWPPSPAEVERVLVMVERELFFTARGLNVEWDLEGLEWPENVAVQVDSRPIAHRLGEGSAGG